MVTTTEFARKNLEPGGTIKIQVNLVESKEISLPKSTSKTDPLPTENFQIIGYATYYLQELNPQNRLGI